MSLLKHITAEIARALAVLAMVFLCFGATPPDAGSAQSAVSTPGTLAVIVSSLCGHDAQSVACHAPTNCCRPDLAALPPRAASAEPAFAAPVAVAYARIAAPLANAAAVPSFRSRAPPV